MSRNSPWQISTWLHRRRILSSLYWWVCWPVVLISWSAVHKPDQSPIHQEFRVYAFLLGAIPWHDKSTVPWIRKGRGRFLVLFFFVCICGLWPWRPGNLKCDWLVKERRKNLLMSPFSMLLCFLAYEYHFEWKKVQILPNDMLFRV